ncbi:hypothetical protein FOL47_004477 [Perkinsus chesapeaki]|uniref:Peptidase M60 domain-containing protein n=1 Tax=Perkinsus chesapeaki TaxID=330153 RepID=A0A7J6M2H7_PERCH|nr:hypothetical protein FOL47_004477 [Perkinsus chesapeaki]
MPHSFDPFNQMPTGDYSNSVHITMMDSTTPPKTSGGGKSLDEAQSDIVGNLDLKKFKIMGTPSTLSVFSDTSSAVISTPEPEPQCLLACGVLGKGRVVTIGHEGYISLALDDAPRDEESKVAVEVMHRARIWASRSDRAVVARLHEDHNTIMTRSDFDVIAVRTNDLPLRSPTTPQVVNRVLSLVRDEGVGLLIGINGWGWECLNKGHTIVEHPMQSIALQAGICFEAEYLPGCRPLSGDRKVTQLSEVSKASFHTLVPLMKVCVVPGKSTPIGDMVLGAVDQRLHLTDDDKRMIRQLLVDGASGRWRAGNGVTKTNLMQLLGTFLEFAPQKIPGDVRLQDAIHYAGKDFPGVCPAPGQDALSLSEGTGQGEEVEVHFEAVLKDTPHSSVTGRSFDPWISTGVYARPGETIRVSLESLIRCSNAEEAAKGQGSPVQMAEVLAEDSGFRVRIGCHKDDNSKLDSWRRWPRISAASKDILSGKNLEVELTSVFGGLVYIERIRENGVEPSKAGNVNLNVDSILMACARVQGGVPALWWCSGVWMLGGRPAENLKNLPRAENAYPPWGEVQAKHLILTLPTRLLLDHALALNDGWAETVADFWDRVVRSHCDIACRPVCGEERFRFVFDVQISAGWMHSGYPVMAHEKPTAEDSCAVWGPANLRGAHSPGKLLTDGDWGLFHELGHHFQRRRWTYKSCGEVTVNLFSMYSMMTIIGKKIPTKDMSNVKEGHQKAEDFITQRIACEGGGQNIISAAQCRKPITDALDQWSPWVGLTMYVDVIETFGWELLRNVLRSFEQDGTYDQQPDPTEWWARVSKACGEGLSLYCRVWGVPVDLDRMDREGGDSREQWLPRWIQEKLM